MISTCHYCASPVDTLRTAARIVASRIVNVCETCIADPLVAAERARAAAEEAAQQAAAEAHAAYLAELAEDAAAEAGRSRWLPRFSGPRSTPTLVATSVIAGAMLLWGALAPPGAPRRLLRSLESHAEASTAPSMVTPRESPLLPIGAQLPGRGIGSSFVHPLPGDAMLLPTQSTRRFGADRDGLGKARGCGQGHCGVDIGEAVGAPIVAVADGVVAKVVRYDNLNGGLYVRLDHADATSSFYFHCKSIRKDLRVGTRVVAGEAIATLGRSGIFHSAPHLHFAIAERQGEHDHYIDPEPLLANAVLLKAPITGDLAAMGGPEEAPPHASLDDAPTMAD